MSTFRLHGVTQVKREMRSLTPRMQKNILNGATAAIARKVRDEAKQNAPREFGTLEDNIIAKRRRGKRGLSRSSVIVREENGRDDPHNAFYWRFQEFGYFARDGSTWIPGTAFITRAYDSLRGRVDALMAAYMRPRIEKALKKRG